MKIAIIGYGKMGKIVEQTALKRGHEIVAVLGKGEPLVKGAEVCIDFSVSEAVLENAKKAAECRSNLIIGTTGWESRRQSLQDLVLSSGIGCVYSPNFSLGVQLFLQIVRFTASLMNRYDMYDVSGLEIHHHEKADSPSGTAKALADSLLSGIARKEKAVFDLNNRKRKQEELHFSSLRCGHIPGTHSVIFDSLVDSITLTHQAKDRSGFALGAVIASELIHGKKGFFTFDELIGLESDAKAHADSRPPFIHER